MLPPMSTTQAAAARVAPPTTPPVDDVGNDSPGEELANAITHGVALLAALGFGAVAVLAAAATGSPLRTISVAIFVAAMCLVYFASTAFHLASRHPSRRHWRLLDHAAIYVLIAGTYTPVMLVGVGGWPANAVVTAVWVMAVAGVVMKFTLIGRYDRFEKIDTFLYLAMGWLGVLALVPIGRGLSTPAMAWLVAGGVFYSAGCVFFLWQRLPYNHAIWHLFVVAGSACHFITVHRHVVPASADVG